VVRRLGGSQSRSGRYGEEKSSLRLPQVETWSPSLKPVAVPTELSQLSVKYRAGTKVAQLRTIVGYIFMKSSCAILGNILPHDIQLSE
jgi:hypothetical protein